MSKYQHLLDVVRTSIETEWEHTATDNLAELFGAIDDKMYDQEFDRKPAAELAAKCIIHCLQALLAFTTNDNEADALLTAAMVELEKENAK